MNMAGREDLGRFLNDAGLLGAGAEIGVDQGAFAVQLLSTWKGKKLYGVDPYVELPASEWRDGQAFIPRSVAYDRAKALLQPFGDRHEFRFFTSKIAAFLVPDDAFDFVYIDANHSYAHVSQDIGLWWPKIKPGGLLGGHDFYWRNNLHQLCGVPMAVGEFCEQNGLTEHITSCKSWWVLKPELTIKPMQ